ncbi:unnamed protein product [Auanema sp. JU1783]|nr:unnamed protein product [Auanema sp. JU1783]
MAVSKSRISRSFLKMFSTSSSLRVSANANIKEIGSFTAYPLEKSFEPGQLFIHRTFAYKGVVVCSFNCRFHEKKEGGTEKTTVTKDYYQVLVHRPDWAYMMFPVDLTSYLQDGSSKGEKLLAMINGMDCVSHSDIMPFNTVEKNPIEHDLFDRIFTKQDASNGVRVSMRPALLENYMASQRTWLAPRDVYKEITDGVEVTVMTFYLGSNFVAGQQRHTWRYVIRIENHTPQNPVILRERSLKIYSLNNMNQVNGHGVIGKQPELNVRSPAFQFSSTIELPHSKGGHMWGTFKMERENGSTFNVTIPTVVLESLEEKPVEVIDSMSE